MYGDEKIDNEEASTHITSLCSCLALSEFGNFVMTLILYVLHGI